MSGVQKLCLNNLNINIRNALIVGIIIAKSSPRTFGSKKKNGELRGVLSFTLRDSAIDTINVDVWGSEYFILTFYERFLVGDVVEISSPKICVKSGDNEIYRPQVTSPFYLSLNEGQSEVSVFERDNVTMYLPLIHIPTKPCAGYCGLSEVLKFKEQKNNVYVDLLVVVKSVKPAKLIKTKAGIDMSVRAVEILDNSTPASLTLDLFDTDTIQRAEEWRPLDSVLFIADARVSWRAMAVRVQSCSRTVVTHQPHTPDAEALRLYVKNQGHTMPSYASGLGGGEAAAWAAWSGERASSASVSQIQDRLKSGVPFCAALHAFSGGEAAAWAAWSGERANSASVSQIQDRLKSGVPFCAALHALLTHLDLDDLVTLTDGNLEDIRVRFADHTGEVTARLPIHVLEEVFGYTVEQLKAMSPDDRGALRWRFLLEQCSVKLAVTPRLLVLTLRRASAADPIPLY